jgi:hypothetical protein
MGKVLDFFGKNPPECVYCGSKTVKRWDHLVPVKDGGETVLRNIVMACQECDDSKDSMRFEEWMKSDNPLSPKKRNILDVDDRIQKIRNYVALSGYTVKRLEGRLNETELEELKAIRDLNTRIRELTEKLIEDYRKRTGDS